MDEYMFPKKPKAPKTFDGELSLFTPGKVPSTRCEKCQTLLVGTDDPSAHVCPKERSA